MSISLGTAEWKKVVHGEICKRLKLEHATKPESDQENRFWTANGSPYLNQKTRTCVD